MLYLAYGMNTNPNEMLPRCPNAKNLGRVDIQGWKMLMYEYATAIPCGYSTLQCVLWDIDERCETELDELEDYPIDYTKVFVAIQHDNETKYAMMYVMCKENHIPPSQEYINTIEEGYRASGLDCTQLHEAIDLYYQ
jgi:gamma-glutamylcyclotransferase (GGCT)/AIG2-like uncharacterized protein YtfP